MKATKLVIVATCLALAACATKPTGRDAVGALTRMEGQALAGSVPWTQYYSAATVVFGGIQRSATTIVYKEHYDEMLVLSQKLDAGSITVEQFHADRLVAEGKTREVLKHLPPLQPVIPGEGVSNYEGLGEVIGGLLLIGATVAAAAGAAAPRQTYCTHIPTYGGVVQSSCR